MTVLEEDGISPEVCIILTDLLGRFPTSEPGYPVVWADVLGLEEAPFGETIRVRMPSRFGRKCTLAARRGLLGKDEAFRQNVNHDANTCEH